MKNQMIEAVQAASDENLFDPHRFAWLEGTALWQVVAGNTYEHITEHMPDIQKWLEQRV